MSWHPNDLVSDADLVAYEGNILTRFDKTDWQTKRLKAIEDWLWPSLEGQGLSVTRFRTRYQPESVLGYTSSTYTDQTAAAISTTTDDLAMATILAASSDALVVGSAQMFRGLSIRILDTPSTASALVTLELWADSWVPVTVTDTTQAVGSPGKPLSRGGSLAWIVPGTWVPRTVNSVGPYYWARLRLSAAPTSCLAGQVSVIRRSRLCAAATLRTLGLIFLEAPISGAGPWADKAQWYLKEAEDALEGVMGAVGGEFESVDTASSDDTIDATEAAQTLAEASLTGPWSMERA